MKLLVGLIVYVAGSLWLCCHLKKKRLELEAKNEHIKAVLMSGCWKPSE